MEIYFYRTPARLFCSILCLTISCTSQLTFADNLFSASSNNLDQNTWFLGAGGGLSWEHFQDTTTVSNGMPVPSPFNQDLFSIETLKNANAQFDIGYRWANKKAYFPYTNIYFQYRSYINNDISGSIEQFSLPQFTNYDYQMKYSADLLTINGKCDLFKYKKWMPYLSAGAGVIFNSVYDYTETPTAHVTPRISPGYTTNNSSHLALTLGAGIDYILADNFWVTLGYEHVFQGSIESGPGLTTWSATSLDFGNVKMDTVFINFTMNLPTFA
jgi:opacity protein-like surface antigen